MAKQETRRRRRLEYRKPAIQKRQKLAEVTEGGNIFVTGRIT